MKSTIVRWSFIALIVGAIAGCGGGGGGGTTPTPTPTPTPSGNIDAAALATAIADPANDSATNPSAAFTAVQGAGGTVVTVASPPKVYFTVISGGKAVTGLTTTNARFIIAKLVPGTNGAPDQWVSYTNTTAKATTTVGPGGAPVLASANQATTDTATDPGQLVYNADGYYTYTFTTDIKDSTKTGGVTYEPSLTHRVAIQLNYTNAAGTIVEVNPTYDFTLDASGNSVAVTDSSKTRKVVDTTSCNECHDKLALHGDHRVDTQYCVLCHNAATTDPNSGNVLDLRTMAHKIHAGEILKTAFNEDYAIWGYRDSKHDYAEVGYPQDIRNCTKCHSASKKDSAGNQLAAQGDNWKMVPSRAACGACHAGINFATGKGVTLADGLAGLTTSTYGHIGGIQTDDSKCALCHSATAISTVYHIPVTPPDPTDARFTGGTNTHSNAEYIAGNQNNLPAGAIKVTWDISSVSKDASRHPVIVFRGLQNGTPVAFNTDTAGELWSNFVGAPNLYWVWAVPQDGIAKPADFNASASTWLKALWNGTATGSKAGTLTGPDASGYYTATLTGVVVTDDAVMLTGGVGYVYGSGSPPLTQTNLPDYPVTASTAVPGTFTGGLAVPAPNVYKVATGYTGRRAIVDNAKCKNCHEALGLFTEAAFHSGQRNDGTTCSWCHNPNLTSSGWAADSTNFVHAIHGASKRTVDYTWHAASTTAGFFNIGYPGILKNCETCHVAGTYDFSASASSSALPNRLFRTVAAKPRSGTTLTADATLSPYTDSVTPYGAGFSVTTTSGTTTAVTTAAATTTLVISPIMTTCVSCHDGVGASGVDAVVHMKQNGGQFYAARGTNPASQETCMLCHGPTSVAPIAAVHAK